MSSPHLVRDRHWSRGLAAWEDGRRVGWEVLVPSKGTAAMISMIFIMHSHSSISKSYLGKTFIINVY